MFFLVVGGLLACVLLSMVICYLLAMGMWNLNGVVGNKRIETKKMRLEIFYPCNIHFHLNIPAWDTYSIFEEPNIVLAGMSNKIFPSAINTAKSRANTVSIRFPFWDVLCLREAACRCWLSNPASPEGVVFVFD